MTDLTPNHPAVLAALDAETCRARTRIDAYAEDQITQMLDDVDDRRYQNARANVIKIDAALKQRRK